MHPSLVALWLAAVPIAGAQTDVRSLLMGSETRRAEVLVTDRTRFTPLVIGLLKDGSADVRRRAAIALREIDSRWEEGRGDSEEEWERVERNEAAFVRIAVPALTVASRDADGAVRGEAMRSLLYALQVRRFGHHGNPYLMTQELRPLLDLGPAIVPTLIEALQPAGDEAYRVQISAGRALSRLKPSEALPALLAATGRLEHFALDEAMLALAEYDDPRVAPAILNRIGAETGYFYHPALYALKRTRGRAVPDIVVRLAHEPAPEYRLLLIEALAFPTDPRALPALVRALEDPDEKVRRKAANVLRRFPQPASVPALLRAFASSEPGVRAEAMRSLTFLKEPAAFPVFSRALADPDIVVSAAAATGLIELDPSRAVPLLLPLVEKNELDLGAFDRLIELRDRRTIPALLARYRGFRGLGGAMGLAKLGVTEPIPDLMEWFGTEKTAEQVVPTMLAYGPLAADALIGFYPKLHPSVRYYLIQALAGTKDPRAIALLRPVAVGKDDTLACAALTALGHLGDRTSIPLLIEKLDHPDWGVACSAAEGLEHLKAYQAVGPLLVMLRRKEGYAEDYAAMALATIGDPRAVEPLIKYLGQEENPWRDRVVSRLGAFRDPRITRFLLEELDEGDVWSACEALVQRGDPSVLPELRRLLESSDENVYDAAKSAIERLTKP